MPTITSLCIWLKVIVFLYWRNALPFRVFSLISKGWLRHTFIGIFGHLFFNLNFHKNEYGYTDACAKHKGVPPRYSTWPKACGDQ